MIIAVFGAGYVGLVSAACFAKLGHQVICADINTKRIEMLQKGVCPIYEEGLDKLVQEQLACANLMFTTDLIDAVQSSQVFIIATGTPSLADGSADLSQVFSVADLVAEHVQNDALLITKSTVPVGTGDSIENLVKKKLASAKKTIKIDVASNPEFLREGCAIDDFLNADRIIVGGDKRCMPLLKKLYQPLIEQGVPFLTMNRTSAELTKYSANAMLACRISFMNQVSQLAQEFNADIDDIREGMALDPRIGPYFLQAGIGYGGSCFPKDVRALAQSAKSIGLDTSFLEAIDKVNELQKNWLFKQVAKHFKQKLQGLKIGFWGLSFKPGTDDLREASSLVAISAFLDAGAKIIAFDPVAVTCAQQLFKPQDDIVWCQTMDEVFEFNLDVLIIATEWPHFKNYSLSNLRNKLQGAPLFDGRNCFSLVAVQEAGIAYYYSVGRPVISKQESMELVGYAN
ncbi:UDP-glucose 6-dehydrogenase [Legionella beliardensis]|uniref:UDP-glucose 6-dehydrogenase n=1 Tax=Legionella beliardensis TaxID=91822 RepID=A0A378HZT1_9GAMM|nr:UDP-glucose/GDP-mannose dehydrogenase family protein [Legionella beliardensis]STX28242.1 UDP-glucose 6-dehydrogenase [Legionella beliardensis]